MLGQPGAEDAFPRRGLERLCVPGPGSAGPDLRSQGSSGKERLSRCARGSKSSGEEFDRVTPLKVPERELF
jgi:hypothetical protein